MDFDYKNYVESAAVKKKRQEAEANSTYKESDDVRLAKDAMNAHEATKVADWTGGNYGDALKGAIDKITNREKFSYDLNGDALYQQYKDQYINQGRLAMNDTIGTASTLTGGYGNSYAVTAGNQAYQGYLQKLNDVVPELYQMAYDRYNQEGQDLKDQYSILNNQYNTEYGEYRDQVSDWNTEANRLSDKYYQEANMDYSKFSDNRDYTNTVYNNERSYDYNLYSDAYDKAFANYQQDVAENQWQADFLEGRRQFEKNYKLNSEKISSSAGTTGSTGTTSGTGDDGGTTSNGTQTNRTILFSKDLLDRKWWGTEMSTADVLKYGTYDNYVSAKILDALMSNKLTAGEARYLLDYYDIK